MRQFHLTQFLTGAADSEVYVAASTVAEDTYPITISNGNSKMGQIWNFSLPYLVTCPGASALCKPVCYVHNRNFAPNIQRIYINNWEASKLPTFAERVISMLRETQLQWKLGQSKILRLHPSGDFYDQPYIEAWIRIVRDLPDWRFYGYTRTWAVPQLEPTLSILRSCPNVVLMASIDESMPPNPDWSLRAFMSPTRPAADVPQCFQEVALHTTAAELLESECGSRKHSKRVGKETLRQVALAHNLHPLFCMDCGHCIYGRGSVWFKMRNLSTIHKFF